MIYNLVGLVFIGLGVGLVRGALWLSRRTTFKQGQRTGR